MSRIGIATWNFGEGTLCERVRTFAEMGYNAVSINNRALDFLTEEEEGEISKIADEHDLLLTFHGSLVSKVADESTIIAHAERMVKWQKRTGRIKCASYDTPHVAIAEGIYRADPQPILGILDMVLSIFSGTGVRVLLEDCPIFPWQAERMKELAEKHVHLAILVDLGHMNLRLREPRHNPQPLKAGAVEEYLKGIPYEIAELHVHSNDGTKDQHAPPYAPNADLATAAKVLREIGFNGVSTIELVPAWCGMQPEEIIPACRKSLDYWANLLA